MLIFLFRYVISPPLIAQCRPIVVNDNKLFRVINRSMQGFNSHFFGAIIISALWYYFGANVNMSFWCSRFGARDQLNFFHSTIFHCSSFCCILEQLKFCCSISPFFWLKQLKKRNKTMSKMKNNFIIYHIITTLI